jgi:hypothetical protein
VSEAVDSTAVEETPALPLDEQPPALESAGGELVHHPDAAATLFRTDDPVELIERASRVADVLKGVLSGQGLTKRISNRDHVLVEGWQTVGSMLGVFAVKEYVREVPWPSPVPEALKALHDRGLVFGYTASYRAQRPDGAIVGGAEADCKRSENTWKGRDDYALKSMAQTRAQSKALRAPLGFVVSLAGYSPTPADEMPPEEAEAQHPLAEEAGASVKQAASEALTYLLDGNPEEAEKAWGDIKKTCEGRMPIAACIALIVAKRHLYDSRPEGPEVSSS